MVPASDLRIAANVASQSISSASRGKRVRYSPTFASGGCSENVRPTDQAESDHDIVAEVALADAFAPSAIVPDAAVGYAAVGTW